MKTTNDTLSANRGATLALAATLLIGGSFTAQAGNHGNNCNVCKRIAQLARSSGLHEAIEDFYIGIANSYSYNDPDERRETLREAWDEYRENLSLNREVYSARLDLCEALDECRYDPEIDPECFLSPEETAADPNPYFPLVPGTTFVYQGETDEGTEIIEVHVSHDTREIQGVTCIVVEDTVWLEDEVIEDTKDWYAQDKFGNVWYFGELTFEFEDGEIVGIEGSWESGEDHAKAGIAVPANPVVGTTYRQEYLLGEAEDAGEVLSITASVDIDFGSYTNCLQTRDFTPLEPDALEHKFYAPGLGFVLEVKPETGEMVELIAVETE